MNEVKAFIWAFLTKFDFFAVWLFRYLFFKFNSQSFVKRRKLTLYNDKHKFCEKRTNDFFYPCDKQGYCNRALDFSSCK